MKKSITFFDHVLKISAVASILLFVIGYTDLKTYYGFFEINISAYLEPSEIILASIDNLIVTLIASLIQLAFWVFFFEYLFVGDSPLTRRPKKYHNEAVARLFANKKTIAFVVLMSILFIVSTILKISFPSNEAFLQIFIFVIVSYFIYMGVFMAGLSIADLLLRFLKKYEDYNPKVIITFLIFVPTILFTVYVKNALLYLEIRRHGNIKKHRVTLNDKTVIPEDDTTIYVGRSKSYIFYWNPKKEQTRIFPSSKIELLNITK